MKVKNILITMLLVACLVASVFLLLSAKKHHPKEDSQIILSDAVRFRAEYPLVGKDNRFVFLSPNKMIEKFESGTGMVFLGFSECSWCQQLAPLVNEAAKLEKLDKIFYLDIRAARSKNDETYQKLVDKLKPHLRLDYEAKPRIYVPDVSTLRDGKIVGHFLQETESDGVKVDAQTYWTKERKTKAIQQLREMIQNMTKNEQLSQDLNNGATLVDVRTKKEFEQSRIEQAINLPLDEIEQGMFSTLTKNAKIYLYCRSGNRSNYALQLLRQAGFSNVHDLGGIQDVAKLGAKIIN